MLCAQLTKTAKLVWRRFIEMLHYFCFHVSTIEICFVLWHGDMLGSQIATGLKRRGFLLPSCIL